MEATVSDRRPSPAQPQTDPAALFEQIAAACRVGCFGPRSAATATVVGTQRVPRLAVAGELTLGPSHPGVLRCLARMAHGVDLARLHALELAPPSELLAVGELAELPTQTPAFKVSRRKSVDEKTHSIEIFTTSNDALLPGASEVIQAWSQLVESGAFRGHQAPWSAGFLLEVTRAGRGSIVASFEFLNLQTSGFDPLLLALSQLSGAAHIQRLALG